VWFIRKKIQDTFEYDFYFIFAISPIHIVITCAYWKATSLHILYQYRKKGKPTHDQSNNDLHFIFYVNTYTRVLTFTTIYNNITERLYYRSQLKFPLLFFLVFITISLLFFNPLYIARKPRTRCIFWYIYIEDHIEFEV
jgi:hypothetical protein